MTFLRTHGYKVLSFLLLLYAFSAGFLVEVPRLFILNETIRNLFFHVPMWMAMMAMLLVSSGYAIAFLASSRLQHDTLSASFAYMGLAFGFGGIFSGMIWANYTWGTPWTDDPKLNGAAVGMLLYTAYAVLRSSLTDRNLKARIASVFNLFALCAYIPMIYILPKMKNTLHPGADSNPAFSEYDLDSRMRPVFYAACLGWILFGTWVSLVRTRAENLKEKQENEVLA